MLYICGSEHTPWMGQKVVKVFNSELFNCKISFLRNRVAEFERIRSNAEFSKKRRVGCLNLNFNEINEDGKFLISQVQFSYSFRYNNSYYTYVKTLKK